MLSYLTLEHQGLKDSVPQSWWPTQVLEERPCVGLNRRGSVDGAVTAEMHVLCRGWVASALCRRGGSLTRVSVSGPVYSTDMISVPREVRVRIKRGDAKGGMFNTVRRTWQVLDECTMVFSPRSPDP